MSTASDAIQSSVAHAGPNLGVLAILYFVPFNAGLYPVTAMAGKTCAGLFTTDSDGQPSVVFGCHELRFPEG